MGLLAARYTAFNIPFIIGPRFGDRDGPTLSGMVYQLAAGSESMPCRFHVLLIWK